MTEFLKWKKAHPQTAVFIHQNGLCWIYLKKKTDSRSCCIDLSVSPLNTVYRLRAERLRYEFSLYRCNARAAQQHKLEIKDRVIIFICMGSMVSLKYYRLMWTMTQVRSFQRTPNYDDPLVKDPISKLQMQLHIFT